MPLVKVKADHRIALPRELAEKLNISVGDYLKMDEQSGVIVMRSVKPETDDNDLPKKGKWARVAERMTKENILDKGSGETLRKASREFRKNFGFREPPHFEHIENGS